MLESDCSLPSCDETAIVVVSRRQMIEPSGVYVAVRPPVLGDPGDPGPAYCRRHGRAMIGLAHEEMLAYLAESL